MTSTRLKWGLGAFVVIVSSLVVMSAFTSIPHTGGDNAGYIALAHGLIANGSYTDVFDPQGLRHTKYPPAFPIALALLIALGARTWGVLKLAAAVPTVVSIGVTYLWAERELTPLGGFAVALVLSVSAGVVYYSHWVLSDPLFLALTMTSLLALGRADSAAAGDGPGATLWLAAGVLAAGLAYFTRSAGLPLIVALMLWLGLRRRWRQLGVTAAVLGVPMLGWWLRGRGEGVAQYGTEFWMVNPYEPALGTIGVLDLLPRMTENFSAYVFGYGPAGVLGEGASALPVIGVIGTVAAMGGWIWTVRRRVGPAELFAPLYAGLILLWPVVWGGDRFALPLFPLVLLYGAIAVREGAKRLPVLGGRLLGAAVVLALLLPATKHLLDSNRQMAACDRIAAEEGPWVCYGPQVGYFVMAATWSGVGLPEGASVLSRKPRHFYLLSGHPSRAFPFVQDADALLALADELGSRYVLLDQWDGLAARYVGAAVRQRPDVFCYARGFGTPAEGGAQLLGILPPPVRSRGRPVEPEGIGIGACPAGYVTGRDLPANYSSSGRIPLLEGLDP